MKINGKTKIYGIIGNPVGHSFSPYMHSTALQNIGINAVYLPFQLQPEQLSEILSAFEVIGVQGFNVTVPYKEAIIEHLDSVSPQAGILKSVNTVIYRDGSWHGESTDGRGFIRGLKAVGQQPVGQHVTVLGAGGAAKSIALALVDEGVTSLTILNRTQKKSEQLVARLQELAPNVKIQAALSDDQPIDILVNTTSVGMKKTECPVADEIIKKSDFVADIIYNPSKTLLLERADALGKLTQNGLAMLLYQGVEAFELWTGQTAPVKVMQQALLESLG